MTPCTRRAVLKTLVAGFGTLSAPACTRQAQQEGRDLATLWFSYGGKNREVLLELVKRFNASQSRYQVRATYQGDYFEALAKVRTALAAGVAPSVTHVVGEVVPYLAQAGVLESLDHYEGAQELGLVPELAQQGSYEGGAKHPLVAIPFNRSTPILLGNARWLDRAGVQPPTTWSELELAARRLSELGTKGSSGYEVPVSWWFWVALVWQAGGELLSPAGEVLLGGDAGVEALEHWQRMVHVEHSMRVPPGRDYNAWQVCNEDFLAQRVGLICTSTAFLRYLEENATFPVRAMPLPGLRRRAVPTGGTLFTILAQAPSREKQAAWAFLRWMTQPQAARYWATQTGYLPVSRAAITELHDDGFYRAHPNDRVVLEQLPEVHQWPWQANLFRVQRDAIEPRLEAAVIEDLDARKVLQEAVVAAGEP